MKQLHSFHNLRKFIILWLGQSVSALGSAMTNYALIIWAYQQQGTASSIAMLSVCSYLPSVLFCFLAGTIADRWDKKKIMLASDFVAACGTAAVFLLYTTGALRVWHLYIINSVISLMNAFQNPASYVAVSLIAPKEHYARVSGMQSFSSALVSILTPALATALLSLTGLRTVFLIDLSSFAFAFLSLLFFIKIPKVQNTASPEESFLHRIASGIRFLRRHNALLSMIFFFAFVNLLASMAGNGILPAMILARTGGDNVTLGIVTSSIGLGTLAGSVVVTLLRPARRKTAVIFWSCAVSFLLCDIPWALGRGLVVWVAAAFLGNFPLPFLNANLTTIMRTQVPIDMQGRVFAARDTLQYITIPLGLTLGGLLADRVFEPFMASGSPLAVFFAQLVGTGYGSGMAVIFLITGLVGAVASIAAALDKRYQVLNER